MINQYIKRTGVTTAEIRRRVGMFVWSVVMLLMLASWLQPANLSAHEDGSDHETHEPGRVLGNIDFPTTAESPEAQAAFIRGMLLLHLFEYPFAREEFIQAQQIEPDFAMAYWGEAMTHNHPIWDRQDRDAARAALVKLGATREQRLATTDDPLEQAFLTSLDFLFGNGPKSERDRAYARVMEEMAARFPDNHEVQLFYALSLFGVQAGVRDIPTYMLCTAIAQSVFSANPQHPGAAHYLIHGVDDPVHSVLGLDAARALARLAPDAGHSLHMTSHIFNALGMWDDVVSANERAAEVANRMRAEMEEAPRDWGHYNFWLLYGYLQQGRFQAARDLLTSAYEQAKADGKSPEDRMILDPDRSMVGSVVQMWVRYLVETRDWQSDIAEWTFNMGDAFDPNLNVTYMKSLLASRSLQAAEAAQYLNQFRRIRAELQKELAKLPEQAPTDLQYMMRLDVLEKEMLAGIEQAKGERQAAAVHARDASDLEAEMPFAFGPPFIDWPSAEFLGDALLDARKITDAADAYRLSLERAHLRSRSLLGLLNTQVRLGEGAKARYTLEQLRIIWRKADPPVKRQLEEAAKGLDDTDSRIVADETASEQNWTVIKPPADTDAESAIPSDQPLSPESSGGGRFTTDPTQDSM